MPICVLSIARLPAEEPRVAFYHDGCAGALVGLQIISYYDSVCVWGDVCMCVGGGHRTVTVAKLTAAGVNEALGAWPS